MIEGKQQHIGCYDDEEDAAVDYARALFKYKGGGVIDLSDVPPQPQFLKAVDV